MCRYVLKRHDQYLGTQNYTPCTIHLFVIGSLNKSRLGRTRQFSTSTISCCHFGCGHFWMGNTNANISKYWQRTISLNIFHRKGRSIPGMWCSCISRVSRKKYQWLLSVIPVHILRIRELLHSDACHKTLLMINQQWFRWWLGTAKQHPITCDNVGGDLSGHLAVPANNEFAIWSN